MRNWSFHLHSALYCQSHSLIICRELEGMNVASLTCFLINYNFFQKTIHISSGTNSYTPCYTVHIHKRNRITGNYILLGLYAIYSRLQKSSPSPADIMCAKHDVFTKAKLLIKTLNYLLCSVTAYRSLLNHNLIDLILDRSTDKPRWLKVCPELYHYIQ